MRVRIYRTPEGEVIVDTPSMKYQEIGIEKCPHPGRFRNGEPFTMEVMEYEDLTTLAVDNEAGSAQFYYDGDTLKHDNDRSELLMHPCEIRTKHRARLERKIDEECTKEAPDLVKAWKWEREQTKLKDKTDCELYEIALANLDEDGHDKPKIRAKLAEKIAELKK